MVICLQTTQQKSSTNQKTHANQLISNKFFSLLVYYHIPLPTFHRHGLGNLPMVYCAKVLLQTLVVLNTEIMLNRRSLANRPKCLFQPISTACLRERAVTKHPSSLSSMPLEIYSNSEINHFLLTTITGYTIQ